MRDRRPAAGQTLVLFVLSLVALIGAAGMVLDLGGSWAQQRNEQRAADLAALAGATSEANGGTRAEIIATALASAQANGFSSSEVLVNIPPTQGRYSPTGRYGNSNDCSTPAAYPCAVEVVINRPHQNGFASVMGMSSWPVSARGVAIGGLANTVDSGASPLMFNVAAVQPDVISSFDHPQSYCDPHPSECAPNNAVPQTAGQFAYTQFCIGNPNCNVDSNTVRQILQGGDLRPYSVTIGMQIGPNNGGQHTGVCSDLASHAGQDLAVAIVTGQDSNRNGTLIGYWIFHLTSVSCPPPGQERITGYFVSDITDTLPLTIVPGGGHSTTGIPVVRLVD